MTATGPRSVSRKLSTAQRCPFKVLVLGQAGVGKTALIVRFITKRFIFDYDPTLERKYTCEIEHEDDTVNYEILDTAGKDPEVDNIRLEEHIKWADAFVLVFSITDFCSYNECTRLRFLIRCVKKPCEINSSGTMYIQEPHVYLVGNKNDLEHERMVACSDARKKTEELGCAGYNDISVMESCTDARIIFTELYKHYHKSKYQWTVKPTCSDDPSLYRRERKRQSVIGVSALPIPFSRSTLLPETVKEYKPSIKQKVHRIFSERVIPTFKSRDSDNHVLSDN